MIDILGSRGACKEMEEVFAALKRSGQEANMLVYHNMVKHLTCKGEVARAIELLRELRPKGFDLDVPHNNLMQALHEREMWAQCDVLLAELRECNIVLGDRFDHYKCFLRMIPYWAARKETHERCTSYLLELEPAKAIHLFNEFLAQLAKRGDAISCISTMRVMRGHQIKPDVGSYCAMFRAATLAKLSTAQDVLLEEMLNDEVTEPNADVRESERKGESERAKQRERLRARKQESPFFFLFSFFIFHFRFSFFRFSFYFLVVFYIFILFIYF
jgi:hypothetical protein